MNNKRKMKKKKVLFKWFEVFMAGLVLPGARVVLWQQEAVVAMQLPQSVLRVSRQPGGHEAVQLAA
jgi:hypothetical protein